MSDETFPECDRFTDHRRAICRGDRVDLAIEGPRGVNSYRRYWGLPPLGESGLLQIGVDWINCPHRGEPVGAIAKGNCGCDRTIYQCGVQGQCLKKLPTARTRQSFGTELNGVTVCATECFAWRQVGE